MTARPSSSWPVIAARLGAAVPRTRLHPAVMRWLERRPRREPWALAFSGGADSLALLLLLWAHWPGRRERLVVLHFNHRLRGRESDADEKFCRRVAGALGIAIRVGNWRRPSRGRARVLTSEAESRRARQEFFARELSKLRARALWTAHQQDDVAESMLMRLARGSGLGGLAAPRPVQIHGARRTHLRPLLTLSKKELIGALRKAGANWREDSSNQADDYFRNRIRRRVVPAWTRAAGRDAVAGAALAREKLEEDEHALETWTDRATESSRRGALDLGTDSLAQAPRAILRRALHRWLLALKTPPDLSRQGFEALLAMVEAGRPSRFSLGRNGFAVLRRGQLTFKKA